MLIAVSDYRYTGSAAVLAALSTYVAACVSDPGIITATNLQDHLQLSPPLAAVDCSVCVQPRPARAKHCYLCKRCAPSAAAATTRECML